MPTEPLRVLGVDTSLRSTGVGVVEARGGGFGALYFDAITNPPKRIHSECLGHLYSGIREIIEKIEPRGSCR